MYGTRLSYLLLRKYYQRERLQLKYASNKNHTLLPSTAKISTLEAKSEVTMTQVVHLGKNRSSVELRWTFNEQLGLLHSLLMRPHSSNDSHQYSSPKCPPFLKKNARMRNTYRLFIFLSFSPPFFRLKIPRGVSKPFTAEA